MTFGRMFSKRDQDHQYGSCSVSHNGSGLLLGLDISMHEETGVEGGSLKHVTILLFYCSVGYLSILEAGS